MNASGSLVMAALVVGATGCMDHPPTPPSHVFFDTKLVAGGSGTSELEICLWQGGNILEEGLLHGECVPRRGDNVITMVDGEFLDLDAIYGAGGFTTQLDSDSPGMRVAVDWHSDWCGYARGVVVMPKPLIITSPADGDTVSLSNGELEVEWSPATNRDHVEYGLSVLCDDGRGLWSSGREAPDTGAYALPAWQLGYHGGTCEVTLELSRVATQTLIQEPAPNCSFENYGEARQVAPTVTFTVTP